MRAGIIGFGLSGQTFHLPLLRASGFDVVSVAVREPAKYGAFPEIRFVTVDQMCADPSIDLIVVASPNAYHEAHGFMALNSGKHVVFEKPLSHTLESARRLNQAARAAVGRVSVFHSRRWDGDFVTLQMLQKDAAVGDWQIFESRWSMTKPKALQRWKDRDSEGGGLLVDFMPHLLDQAIVLLGVPQKVTLDRATQRVGGGGADCLAISMVYGNRRARLFVDCFAASQGQRFRLAGTLGEYVCYGADSQEAQLRSGMAADDDEFGKDSHKRESVLADFDGASRHLDLSKGAYVAFYHDFRIAIETGAPVPVSTQEAERVVEIIDSLNRNEIWIPG